MNKKIHVLIIDDHPTMAAGLQYILEQEPSIRVVGIAANGSEGIEFVSKLLPSVVLLDMNLPDETGILLCARIKEKHPSIHIIIHTGYDYEPYFNQLLECGASGMMNKNASPQELIEMIHTVLRGNTILPLHLFRQMQLHRSDDVKHYWEADLTATEQKILTLVIKKTTNADIGKKIHASESSVEKYLKKIYDKLGVRTKKEALAKIKDDDRFKLLE